MDLVGKFVKIVLTLSFLYLTWEASKDRRLVKDYCSKEFEVFENDMSQDNVANLSACLHNAKISGGIGSEEPIKRRSHL